MRFIRNLSRLIGFATFLFGIFWLPKDLLDWRDAAEPWKRVLAMIDQNTALWVFAVAALLYIAWTDVRPLITNARSSRDRSRREAEMLRPAKMKDWVGRNAYRIWEISFLAHGFEPIKNYDEAVQAEKLKNQLVKERRYYI